MCGVVLSVEAGRIWRTQKRPSRQFSRGPVVNASYYSSLDCLRCLRTTISRTTIKSAYRIASTTLNLPLARIPAVVVVSCVKEPKLRATNRIDKNEHTVTVVQKP
jgi:hypothetical protein